MSMLKIIHFIILPEIQTLSRGLSGRTSVPLTQTHSRFPHSFTKTIDKQENSNEFLKGRQKEQVTTTVIIYDNLSIT